MIKVLLSLSMLCFSIGTFAQNTPLYYRVKIETGATGLTQLAASGVAVDHGDYKKGMYFTSDFSEAELKIIKNSGLPYEIEIADVSRYYEERNENKTAEKPYGADGCDKCDVYATPTNFQLGTMGGFYKYQEFLNALDSMRSKYPNLITAKQPISTTLSTIEGRPVYYVRVSDNPDVDENEPEVLYDALHHAREPESLSQLIFYMWYLLENYNTDAYVKYLVDHTEMYFVPMINPDGYLHNQSTNPNGGGMWRKNRRDNADTTFGVDLNRNYDAFWGYDNIGSSNNGIAETYRGTAGFSEPETQMIRDFCNAHEFKTALNAHTFSNLLIYPWGYVESLETEDSLAFRHIAKDAASCSGFAYGTGDETVGYVSNGDSDDWMYGNVDNKPKIFSLTPEAGKPSDGFWPQSNRIIPIAKQTVDQNLDMARYATPWAELICTDGPFFTFGDGFHYRFTRTGLSNSNFDVSFQMIGGDGMALVQTPHNYSTPELLQTHNDAAGIGYVPEAPLNQDNIRIAMHWENGDGFIYSDTISRYFGVPITIFQSNCDNLNAFQTSSGWGVSTQAAEGSGSITDSPNGNYSNNANKSITTLNTIDLTNATVAFLSFDTKWDLERSYDDVTVEAAIEGGVYAPLCGRYNHLGNDNQNNRKAIYDGTQADWIKEYINMEDYLGKKISIRFTLHSDQGATGDGFYFDDMKVQVFENTVGIKDIKESGIVLQNAPNPCFGNTQITYSLPKDKQVYYLNITDLTGRSVMRFRLDQQKQIVNLDVNKWRSGIYFYAITADDGSKSEVKKMVVLK